MSDLAELVRIAQHKATSLSTECLVIAITQEASVLNDKLAGLEMARLGRGSAPDGEMRYADAFGDVMATVLTLAAFTTELVSTRIEGWDFTNPISPADIHLN
jgi:hypothetical protein